ncbi:MAG: hypothetical protein CBCREVIR_3096 [Candidatus Burkholderia crenata]|nr:MAG: hypothetical protein CBCREVIR_3096 [Candidatus Burkholderia crenata]
MTENARDEVAHLFATIGSLTKRGGRVTTASSGLKIAGLAIARANDVVSYPDGSEAVIIEEVGFAAVFGGRPLALVGSRLSNGDRIVETPQAGRDIIESFDKPIEGLFDPPYVPSARMPEHRFAVRGSTTTANGGVLRKTTGNFPVSEVLGNAGCLSDLIEYAEGSTAMIVSGWACLMTKASCRLRLLEANWITAMSLPIVQIAASIPVRSSFRLNKPD